MSRVWKVAPGRKAVFWRDCFDNHCIAIDWLNDVDLRQYADMEQLEAALADYEQGGSNNARSISQFVFEMEVGDTVVANDGRSKAKGIGVIASDYLPPRHRRNPFRLNDFNAQVRLVDWKVDESVEFDWPIFNIPTVQRLKPDQVTAIYQQYLARAPQYAEVLGELFPARLPPGSSFEGDNEYEPNSEDQRQTAVQQIKLRRGQQSFRLKLLDLHSNTCVVTGCQIPDILEAAHIAPYLGDKDNHVENGLLLRADIHTLFDIDLLGIDPASLRVVLAPIVAQDAAYRSLHGTRIRCARNWRPNQAALQQRFELFKMANQLV
jgi:hypothetical protein